MVIAVDPSTNTIRDFASDAVTAGITVDPGITFGEQAWNGQSRKYIQLTQQEYHEPNGNFIAFTGDKHQFILSDVQPTASAVWIGQKTTGLSRFFGLPSSTYFAAGSLSAGGPTHPWGEINSIQLNGGNPAVPNNTKVICGFSIRRGGASVVYTASDTASAMTATPRTFAETNVNYSIEFVV